MEKRIKTLYIITIMAILAFLGMQAYWLYGRYEFSLKEYQRSLSERIAKCVDDYNTLRRESCDTKIGYRKDKDNDNILTVPTFSLRQEYGDSVKTTRTAKISTYLFSAHKLLGLEPGTPLSEEQKNKAMQLAQTNMITAADSIVFDASGAKDENEAWTATQNVQTERKCPFTSEGIDSILINNGIKAETTFVRADSMVWNITAVYNSSSFSPGVSMTIPYSQLEGLTVRIVSKINPLEVLPGMWQALIITIVISTLLIVCLVLQFSTVLKLSRLDKLRNSFITTMIHELKRPIATLKMCVSGIENEQMMADCEVKAELTSETRGALDNLSAYFSKLRDITFNDVGQIPLNISSVGLRKLFDDVIKATVIPSDKTVTFDNGIDPAMEVNADKAHLFNIINNLVENALKYSGDSVEIKACATETDENISISVSDNGAGISSADIKHIFRRFYRGKASATDIPGMGLGLAYVKLLTDAHGGSIAVESTEGKGSCFTITLPL